MIARAYALAALLALAKHADELRKRAVAQLGVNIADAGVRIAELSIRMDGFERRLERIVRRLDLVEDHP